MAITVIVHIENQDPVVGEMEELPSAGDQFVQIKNPRLRDGKDLTYLVEGVTTVIWPIMKINFIELMPTEEEEKIIGFVRE
jgi:hypothetical protein